MLPLANYLASFAVAKPIFLFALDVKASWAIFIPAIADVSKKLVNGECERDSQVAGAYADGTDVCIYDER
jgi:hypothetical protein